MRARGSRHGYRRTGITALVSGAVLTLTFLATAPPSGANGATAAAPAQAADAAGIGNAIGETVKIDPKAGGLTIGATLGRAIAGHANTVSQASAQAIDLGVIGVTLAASGCDGSAPTLPASEQPQPLQVDSRQQGADQEQTVSDDGGAFTRTVVASNQPFAQATTRTAPFGIAGVITVGAGTATTSSGVVNGQRIATATVDIGTINIAGVVSIGGLHWEATYPSGSDAQPTGSFTSGNISLGGVALPLQNPITSLAQLDALLDPLGLHITVPTAMVAQGVQFVSPLSISVVPNAARDALANAVLGGIQPIRQQTFDALLQASCKFATGIEVADIVIGSITGAGSFNLLLGGVQATSGATPANSFALGFGGLSPNAGGTTPTLGTTGSTGSTGTGASTGIGVAPSTGTTPAQTASKAPAVAPTVAAAAAVTGERGGAMLGVGLGTLAFLALMAEGDRRKMRRAQREIPTFQD